MAASFTPIPRRATIAGLGASALAACGKNPEREIKALKIQVQDRYGAKDYRKGYELAQKGLDLARSNLGDKHPDTLYFAQAVSMNATGLGNSGATINAMKQELDLRSKAGQSEQKLQGRRTKLIQMAEESGDKATSIEQSVIIAKSIGMGSGKDPQPTYRPEYQYPADLARQKVEGDVEMSFNLDANGTPQGIKITRSIPQGAFDIAAMENFRRWRFTPFIENGQPVSSVGHHFLLAFRTKREKPPTAD
jgi:TonB family protein